MVLMTGANRALSQGRTPLTTLWEIGKADNSDAEFALAPSGYSHLLEKDFGWEDGFYLIGSSTPEKNWPYALPGPEDSWGGTSNTAGWRSSVLNILFGIDKLPHEDHWELVIDLLDVSAAKPPLLKVTINDSSWEYYLPAGSGDSTLKGSTANVPGDVLKIPVPAGVLKQGGNEVSLTSFSGSWLVFDQVRMDGPSGARIAMPHQAFIRDVSPANYDITDQGKAVQPLLIDVQHVSGDPLLEAFVDGKKIFQKKIDTGRYIFEAPMPAVTSAQESTYEIKLDGHSVRSGSVRRSPKKQITPAGYVDTKMGTAHSRWMIAPGPWMPFSMVKISPDNQNAGWQAGYDPIFESIGGFSHIHEWTMSGLSMLPVNGPLVTRVGDQRNPRSGYRSSITKNSEEAPLGYYKVHLKKYNITAELTATIRCSFQRYTYPKEKTSRVLVDFSGPAEYDYKLQNVEVTKVSDHRIEGFSKQVAPAVWGKDIDQDYTVHFVMEFDQPITGFGYWIDSSVRRNVSALKVKDAKHAGVFLEFNQS